MTHEPLPLLTCPSCGKVGGVSRATRPAVVTVREQEFAVVEVVRICSGCGIEWLNTRDPDWRPAVFEKLGIGRI